MSNYPYYKTNDLLQNQNTIYPWHPTENLENNPYKKHKQVTFKEEKKVDTKEPVISMVYKTEKYSNTMNPEVWGPAFWFSLHNGALRYPINASPLWAERMKQFILGIPVMVPCVNCSEHATAHIETNADNLDTIVSGRANLFKFFWEFHNFINVRLNKPTMTLEEAYKLYNGEVYVTKLKYE